MYQYKIFCYKCTKCIDNNNCLQCYRRGCDDGLFFNSSMLPYKCSSCSSAITNCFNCFANQTDVYCSLCDYPSNYELSAD